MNGTQLFTALFAIASIAVSASAIWRLVKAKGLPYKPLWILGSLFGFVGFGTSLSAPGDLYLQMGIQIPVVIIWMTGSGDIILKSLFPVVAAAALVRLHQSGNPP